MEQHTAKDERSAVDINSLLRRLESGKIQLWVEGDKLRFRAPAGALTSELRTAIGAHKSALIALLTDPRRAAIPRVPDADHYEVSEAQRRLWLLAQLGDGSTAYNVNVHLILRGDLDAGVLERALRRLVERHESLRTTFITVDGEPRQRVHDASIFQMDRLDLRGDPEADARLAALTAEEGQARFDLERGPLFRARLVALDERRHALLLSMHHVITDGWSLSVLLRELSSLYSAYLASLPDPLPPLPIQYRDFTHWQSRLLQGEGAAAHRDYWRQKLADVTRLELPIDAPRPPRQTFRGNGKLFAIDAQRTAGLRALGRRHQASLFMVLVALVKTLLFRYTRQAEIVVATPIAGRTHDDLRDQIGFFLNTLVLVDEVRGDRGFDELLGAVRRTALEAYEHQDYPFNRLVHDLQPDRDHLARNPIFDVLVLLQNAGKRELLLPGLEMEPLPQESGNSRCDLAFDFEEQADCLELGLRYSTDLFRDDRIDALGRHFLKLVDGVLADAQRPIADLDLLSEEERRTLAGFHGPRVSLPDHETVVDWFEQQVARTPASTAIVSGDVLLSYGELNRRSNQVARSLRARGVGVESRVGLLLDRSEWLPTGEIGVLKAGAMYVPMDPSHPPARLAEILRDCRCAMVLTRGAPPRELVEQFADLSFVGIEELATGDDENLGLSIDQRCPCYIIYTSGSTGQPKGVVLPHRGLLNFLLGMKVEPGFGPSDTLLSVATPAFDIFGLDLFLPLITGGRVVLAGREDVTDGRRLIALLETWGVTMLQATPSTWRLLLEAGFRSDRRLKMLSGAEPLPVVLAEALLARGAALWNLYGPTETTVWCSLSRIRSGQRVMPVGHPICNVRMYVVDENLALLPVGVPGEICVAGEGVSRGYWDAPALTAEKFVPDPFDAGGRLYRSGDLGRWLPEGEIEFFGRRDGQVKIRGHRIEIGDVENHILGQHGVRAVTALARDIGDEKELVAYLEGPGDLDLPRLREALGRALPAYMVPSRFVVMDRLPLTRTGKINRKALLAADTQKRAPAPAEAAHDEAERKLMDLWSEVLGVDTIGRHDNFFDLGGHSIKATALSSALRVRLEVSLSLADIFNAPTLSEMAEQIRAKAPSAFVPIARTPDAQLHPASHAQKRMWILSHMKDASIAYNIPTSLLLEGELDVDALEQSFQRLVDRHESLRTALIERDGEPWQAVRPRADFRLTRVDLRQAADPEREARRLSEKDALTPFDLERVPLLRAAVLRLAPARHALLINMHHIVADAWSMRVMARELSHLYNAAVRGADAALPELRIHYRDYAAWHAGLEERGVFAAQRSYWLAKLREPLPERRLPHDLRRPDAPTWAGSTVEALIPSDKADRLRDLGQAHGGSLFVVLVSAIKALFHLYAGEEDVIVGCAAAGRNHPDLKDQIGFYVNTLALRDRVRGTTSFESLVRQVRETVTEAYEHQDYPFDLLVGELPVTARGARKQLFDVMVDFHVSDGPDESLAGVRATPFSGRAPISKFDLLFLFVLNRDGLRLILEYNTDLHSRRHVEQIKRHFEEVLDKVIADPACPVLRLFQPAPGDEAQPPVRGHGDDAEQFNF